MRVVRLYYLFQFFFSLLLWVPVFYEVQKRVGISDPDIFQIQSIYYLAFLLCEIPTGWLADRWTKLGCLRLGSLILILGNALPVLAPNYGGFLWHFLLIALARSLISGASSAYLYEYLAENGKPHAFKKAEGLARAYSLGGKVLLWAGVSVLMKWNLMLPYTLSAVASGVALLIAFILPSVLEAKNTPATAKNKTLTEAWFVLRGNPRITLVVLQGVAIFVFSRLCQINLFQPILNARGFDLALHGGIMGVITVFEALGSAYPESFQKKLGPLKGNLDSVFVLTAIMGLCMIVMAAPSLGQLGTWVGLGVLSYVTGVAFPVQRQLLNDTIDDSRFRATFLSLESLVDRGATSLMTVFLGYFVERNWVNPLLAGSGVACLLSVFALVLYSKRKGWTKKVLNLSWKPLWVLLLCVLSGGVAGCGPERTSETEAKLQSGFRSYTAKESTQARMKFVGLVEMKSDHFPSQKEARSKVLTQLDYLFGPMAVAEYPGVPKGDHRVTEVTIIEKGDYETYIVTYRYEGTVAIKVGKDSLISITLPIDPDQIYEQSKVSRNGNESYPCTDEVHDGEEDFWYFWSPKKAGCLLKEGKHYWTLTAQLERAPNTRKTYPEYPRLIDRKGVISVALLMGMDDPARGRNPMASADENAQNARKARKALIKRGFESRLWTKEEVWYHVPALSGKEVLPYIEEFSKKTKRAKIVVRLFFGASEIDQNPYAFHALYKEALESASVVIYDGHSGLGGNLDLEAIEAAEGFKIQFDPKKYQIYFFNSCSSYTYFNSQYFERKGGSKNLDIMTNGLATDFDVLKDTNFALLQAIEDWASGNRALSYQEIAANIDSENLFGVNGDDDNPTEEPTGEALQGGFW